MEKDAMPAAFAAPTNKKSPPSSTIVTNNGAEYPRYRILSDRVATFTNNWPVSMPQRPNEMASAGFYYTGYGDHVHCFYCGGGLKNWAKNDKPWEEHARWYGECAFLLLNHGQGFVDDVKSGINVSQSLSDIVDTERAETDAVKIEGATENIPEIKQRVARLEKELEELRMARKCKICGDSEARVAFMPCAHFVACVDCATALRECPICKARIESFMKIIMV